MTGQIGTLHVRTEATVDAPRARVWRAVLALGEWWPHRFRSEAGVALEPWVGGRFLEDWGDDGGGTLYGQVTELAPPERLTLTGAMGMSGAVVSRWTLSLEERGDRTLVRLDHSAVGDVDEQARSAYATGWDAVLAALAAAVAGDVEGSLRSRAHF